MSQRVGKVYAFIDTNLQLHFKDFDQIDWPSYLKCEKVCLVIAPITISELEKFKYDRESQRRQKRSRAIIKKISDLIFQAEPAIEVPVKDRIGVSLLMQSESPDLSIYSGLQKGNKDDELIASILKFKSDNPEIILDNVVLISDDIGMLNKARAKGIKIVQMDESFRLPDERTLDQEKIVRLERQIKELEDRQPLLKLSFLEKGTSLEEVQLNLDILPDQDRQDLINLVEAESKAISWVPSEPTIPKTKTFQRSESDISDISDVINAASTSITNAYHALSKLEIISEIEIDRYQIDSTKYLERYQNYLQNNHSYERRSRLSRPLSFQVINVGTSPAIGTIVSIRFPKALEVFYWDEFPPRPEKPSRPIQPRTQIEKNLIPQRILDLDASHSAIFLPALDSLNSNIETEVLRISKTNHTLVEWNGLKVLHQIPLPLTILGVVFPDQIGDMNYTLYYEIFAENISYKVEGKLEISVHGEITKKTIPHPM